MTDTDIRRFDSIVQNHGEFNQITVTLVVDLEKDIHDAKFILNVSDRGCTIEVPRKLLNPDGPKGMLCWSEGKLDRIGPKEY